MISADGTIIWVSSRGPARTGYRAEELIGKSAFPFLHPEDAELAMHGIAMGLVRPERLNAVPQRFVHKDGGFVFLETQARLAQLRRPDGSIEPVIVAASRELETRVAMEHVLQSVAAGEPAAASLDLVAQLATPAALGWRTALVVGELRPSGPETEAAVKDDALVTVPGSVPPELLDPSRYRKSKPPWEEAVADGEMHVVDDLSRYPAGIQEIAAAAGLIGSVAIPVEDPGSSRPAVIVSWCDFDLSIPVLPVWLRTQVVPVLRVVLEQRRARARLEWAASYDSLTGLANRARLFDILRRTLARARGSERVGILYVDLDGFKAVNDTLGHASGDEVLAEVAQRFANVVRPQDLIGRLGGDEFALISPGCRDAEQLVTIGNRLVTSLEAPVTLSTGQEVRIGASVGAVAVGEGSSADDALKRADVALYFAKRHGRGAVHVGPGD